MTITDLKEYKLNLIIAKSDLETTVQDKISTIQKQEQEIIRLHNEHHLTVETKDRIIEDLVEVRERFRAELKKQSTVRRKVTGHLQRLMVFHCHINSLIL